MKKRFLITALVLLLTLSFMSVTAYAGGGDCTEPEPTTEETPIPATEEPVAETGENPFTPAGTGTVIDNATDGDGKEFFTIMTPAENVFYLIIDRQRETENVYFLNAVTEADLLALAVIPEKPAPEVVEPAPAPTPEPEPEPEPKKSGGGGMIIIVVLVLLGGGAGWYFKIYRPKQQQADTETDFEYSEETELYGENDLYGEDDSGGDYDGYGGDPDNGEWGDGAEPEDDPPWDDE